MKIDYGKEGLEFSLDPKWNVTILRSNQQTEIKNPVKAIKDAILNPIDSKPLSEIIKAKTQLRTVCIVIDDVTRPVPSRFLLEALIELLNTYGVEREKIIILVATGLHRKSNDIELKRMIGSNLHGNIKVVNHDATNKDILKFIGTTKDQIPIYINKYYYESDLKIITGYVEPHFFFGVHEPC